LQAKIPSRKGDADDSDISEHHSGARRDNRAGGNTAILQMEDISSMEYIMLKTGSKWEAVKYTTFEL
jgi:hypothetical protein